MRQFFITTDDKSVNLREVTSIAFEEKNNFKIIFNMSYPVSLRSNPNKLISDYVYSIYNNRKDFRNDVNYLMNLVEEYQWIKAKEPRIINPDYISFITQDYNKNRIIINIASSVSFHGLDESKTSDFVYINCNTKDEFKERLRKIRDITDYLIL